MRANLGLAVIGILMAIGSAHAAPARLLYKSSAPPPPQMPAPVTVDLNGTAWLGKYISTTRTFIFEPDGTLSYRTATKAAKIYKNRGKWKLEGNKISFEYFTTPANVLMEFNGTVTDANTIVGEATYRLKNGAKEEQIFRRSME
jgi:hypothetical protein